MSLIDKILHVIDKGLCEHHSIRGVSGKTGWCPDCQSYVETPRDAVPRPLAPSLIKGGS